MAKKRMRLDYRKFIQFGETDYRIKNGPNAHLIEYALFDPESNARTVRFDLDLPKATEPVFIIGTVASVERHSDSVLVIKGLMPRERDGRSIHGDAYEIGYNPHARSGYATIYVETFGPDPVETR